MKLFTDMSSFLKTLVLLCALALSNRPGLSAANFDWPKWRGPDRTDVSKETGLLKAWPAGGPNRVWLYQNAGEGYSGPAIAAGKLFALGSRDDAECLLALDAATGKELWIAKLGPLYRE